MDLVTKRVFITSQNYGFMVDDKTLAKVIIPTHISLFDNSRSAYTFVGRIIDRSTIERIIINSFFMLNDIYSTIINIFSQ